VTILDPIPGRTTSELTRRDVVRTLLSVPATDALAALPGLQRELITSGDAMSPTFWAAAEQVLGAIASGRATAGSVRRWVQATGTEPIDLLPQEGFVWPDEDERGPVAAEMHTALVAHLETLVADATIDPDRLLEGVPEEWAAYEQLQVAWLYAPLPDGREPVWAVVDEYDEELLAEWAAADAEARAGLTSMLAGLPERPRPDADLATVCRGLRAGLEQGEWPYDLLRAAGGVDPAHLPSDDVDLWLTLAAGVVNCREEPSEGVHAAWATLAQPEWSAAVVTLVRGGPGTPARARQLAQDVVEFDFAVEEDDLRIADTAEDAADLTVAFGPVVMLWSALGAVDADERLTPLGWWGLPEALDRAWSPAAR
jgi:hypothetical protein